MIDKAQQLTLTAPEMTVLIGGMRMLGANFDGSQHGDITERIGVLITDFFINFLDIGAEWKATDESKELFEGRDRLSGKVKYTASRANCVFHSIRSRIGIEVRSAIRIHSINRELNFFYRFLTRFFAAFHCRGIFPQGLSLKDHSV